MTAPTGGRDAHTPRSGSPQRLFRQRNPGPLQEGGLRVRRQQKPDAPFLMPLQLLVARGRRLHATTWLGADPEATLLGVFPKELKRVHTESARGGDSSLIRHCQNLERPRRLDGWDSRGPPRQWRIRHPQRDSCPATNSCGGLGCARLSEGAHRRGLHTACFRPRGVPGKGQLWTVKGQRLSGPWAREGGTGGAQGTVGPRNHCAVLPRWARDTTHLSKPTDPAPPGLSLTCSVVWATLTRQRGSISLTDVNSGRLRPGSLGTLYLPFPSVLL